MHRIDTSTAQADKFGEGKNGFTGGNPQTGELPTALDADYFDSIQEEISGVIEAAGIALDKTQRNQLLTALPLLFLSRANPFADIAADGAAAIATSLANLGLGDIALAGVCTGVLDDAGHIDIPMVINGEKKKLIIQWGSTSTTTSGATVTLPTTFPTKYCAGVGCETGAYASIKVVAIIPLSLSTIGVYGRAAGTSTLANTNVKWIVIGY
ncbi:gp53-like domain-containing protein [Mangrovibacter plantisponsor]|uniref:Putative tail fiber protein gp53-like C-terminal domain-containing protein n=1 Tax=Mangrovibacter plantisponsor TaxID=451513 RepID=A0A317PWP4_9ENTR|nr:hypothetical protein [Mangrovibacter plantisponsor]PWW05890.1 hypothetical protein DES37_112156 [Mangrovibacter plantisponsor]